MKHIRILRNFFQVWCPPSPFITFIDAGHQKRNLKYYFLIKLGTYLPNIKGINSNRE